MLRQRADVKGVVTDLLKRIREWSSDSAPDERPLTDTLQIVAKSFDRNERVAECLARDALKRRQVHRRLQFLALIEGGAAHLRHRTQIRHAFETSAPLESGRPDARQRSLEIDISQTRAILKGSVANRIDGPRCGNRLKRGAAAEHGHGYLCQRSRQRNARQRSAAAQNAQNVIAKGNTFRELNTLKRHRISEGRISGNELEGRWEVDFREAAATIHHRTNADFLDALVEGELFKRAGILQHAIKVLDGARNAELLNLDEIPKIPSAEFFERIGQDQLLDILSSSPPRKLKAGNLISLPPMFDRARHDNFSHTAFGNDARDFSRAVNGSLACISHAILNNVEFLCDVCSRCGRTLVCKCNVAYRTSRQRRNRQNKREEKGCDAPLQAGKGHRPPPEAENVPLQYPSPLSMTTLFPSERFC